MQSSQQAWTHPSHQHQSRPKGRQGRKKTDHHGSKDQTNGNRRRRGRRQEYVQTHQGGPSAPYTAPSTVFHDYASRPVPVGFPGQSVPPGLGYGPRPVPAAPPAPPNIYHGDDSRYVASNNCIQFNLRGTCTKGKQCEWRHFDVNSNTVVETLYDPKSGGPGIRARVMKQLDEQKQSGSVARIGPQLQTDLDAAAEVLVNNGGVRHVNEQDPTCWDYNSVRGCMRPNCYYVHKFVPYQFIHPYTGEVVDPAVARAHKEARDKQKFAATQSGRQREFPSSLSASETKTQDEEYAPPMATTVGNSSATVGLR